MVTDVFDFIVTAIEMENWEHGSPEYALTEYLQASCKVLPAYEKIRAARETIAEEIYYRQGFSHALRLILQALQRE